MVLEHLSHAQCVICGDCQKLPSPTLQADTCSSRVVVLLMVIMVIHCQHSSRNPPQEQLLEELDAGGVLFVIVVS